MTAAVLTPAPRLRPLADQALTAATRFWFAAMVVGQGLFLFYIVRFYFPSTLAGNFQAWRLNDMLIKGYVAGDTAGNLAFGAHVLLAGAVTFAGTLQLVPQIRARAPAVHRWIGRVFLVTAMGASLAGLWMTWVRGTGVGLVGLLATPLDAALILSFGALAWRTALKRDFTSHRRWAMRTFIVANGVWFQRLGYALAALSTHAMGVSPPTMESLFFKTWSFGSYLAPLAVLQLYLLTQRRDSAPAARLAMAGGLFALTALMSVGVAGSWLIFFSPVLSKL